MVPLDPPPLIKGSSNECRKSGRRGLGQMNTYSENDCPVAHRKTKWEKKKKNKKRKKQDDDRNINSSVILVQDLDPI